MPGKSRKRRGKFKQPIKIKKGRRNHQAVISQQEIVTIPEKIPTAIPEVAISGLAEKSQLQIKKTELFFELRRIGIFAGLMLVVLIVLAITLK
ncbi:MAG: hypothetical protein JSV74_02080 [Dehalococcoidia bacterium]|nr:MAG: hypothetical protein JSV74_02080 [Dehalococcoidia bacterium]